MFYIAMGVVALVFGLIARQTKGRSAILWTLIALAAQGLFLGMLVAADMVQGTGELLSTEDGQRAGAFAAVGGGGSLMALAIMVVPRRQPRPPKADKASEADEAAAPSSPWDQ